MLLPIMPIIPDEKSWDGNFPTSAFLWLSLTGGRREEYDDAQKGQAALSIRNLSQ
jgi:hypothetical protein